MSARATVIEEVDQPALEYVVEHLRPAHADELSALCFDGVSRADYVQYILAHQGAAYTAFDRDGQPAVIGGISLVSPGVAQGWMLATPRIDELGVLVTRHMRRVIAAAFASGEAHRVQALLPWFDQRAIRWLLRSGFHVEQPLREYGRHREDFVMLALLDRHWSDGHGRHTISSATDTQQVA